MICDDELFLLGFLSREIDFSPWIEVGFYQTGLVLDSVQLLGALPTQVSFTLNSWLEVFGDDPDSMNFTCKPP